MDIAAKARHQELRRRAWPISLSLAWPRIFTDVHGCAFEPAFIREDLWLYFILAHYDDIIPRHEPTDSTQPFLYLHPHYYALRIVRFYQYSR